MVCLVAGRMGRIENKREKIRLCAVFFFFFLINLFIYKDASHVTFFFFLLLTHKGTKSTQQYPSFLFFKSPYIIVLGFFNPSPN